jgi:hypothetical protein
MIKMIIESRKKIMILFIIIIINYTRFDVNFSQFMRKHLCKICMREKLLVSSSQFVTSDVVSVNTSMLESMMNDDWIAS